MYDVIVVGARCAGSPTAMLLARKGYRVLLIDKSAFPSDTMSTCYVWQPGVACLKRWGLLEAVVRSNCPPAQTFVFDVADVTFTAAPPAVDDVVEAYCPRRTVLDKILVDGAVAAGAELREKFSVEQVLIEDGAVIGIRGHSRSGPTVTEKARIVVGADGKHSVVASGVGPTVTNNKPALTCWYYSFWSGISVERVESYGRDGRWIVVIPTNDGLTLIAEAWTNREFAEFRADIERNFLKALRENAPHLFERVKSGKREERFVGTADLPNFFRKPYGSGWALVGDAGYHKDPILAQGITNALRHAELLAGAIDEGISGRQELQAALADYERSRNEDVLDRYELNCNFATLAPLSAEMRSLFAALSEDRAEADRFCGAVAGTVPVLDFFAPENVGRLIASSRT